MSRLKPSSKPKSEAGDTPSEYRPSVTRHARNLIARIQKNQDDVEAIEELAEHYAETGDQPSLVNLLEGWGDTLGDAHASADAYLRAADAALLGLFDRERARALYERALSREPVHVEALDRVLRLLGDDGNLERQKQVLKFVAYRLGEHPCDPVHHASVYFRLGTIYETHFDEPGKAAASYRSAIERNPLLVPAIVGARRLYQAVGNGRAVAALYEFEIEATPHDDDKRALLVALAEVKRRQLGDLDGAVGVLRRTLQSAPGDIEALRMLGEVLVERSEHGDKTAGATDRRRAAEVFFQLGRALPEQDGHAYLQRALELCPEHEKAAKLLYDAGARDMLRAPERDDKTQLLDMADLQAAEQVAPTEQRAPVIEAGFAADGGSTIAPGLVRDSAEVWLSESEPRRSALSTGELLPLEITGGAGVEERPSSLPPRTLAPGVSISQLMPSQDALRAPAVPSALVSPTQDPRESAEIPISRPRRSVPPPPPPAALRLSAPPPPPSADVTAPPTTPRPSAPPPAYAEIPGESGEHFTPVRTAFKRSAAQDVVTGGTRREPTLPTWRLPSDLGPALEDIARRNEPNEDALTPIVNELPAVKPVHDLPVHDDGAIARLSSLPVTSTQKASEAPAAEAPSTASPSVRPPSRLHTALNERFQDLARSALHDKAGSDAEGAAQAELENAANPQPSAADGTRVTADEPICDPAVPSLDVEVGALSDSNFYVGFENRIESGGLFVATYTPQPRGTHVELRVALPGGFSARALGRVWRIRDQVEPFSDEVPGMWVQLTALSQEALHLFDRFASHRPPLFAEE